MYPKLMSPLRLLSPALPLTLRFSIAVTHHQTVDNLFESIKEAKNHEQHPSQTNDDGEKLSNAPRTESSALGDPVYPAVSPDPAISSAQHTHHNSEQICWDARPRARITRAERAAAWASGRLRAVIPAPTVPNNHETLGRVAEAGASVAVAELHSIRPPKTQHLTHHSIRTIPAHVSDHEDIFPTGSSQSLHPQTPRPPPPKENRAGPLKSPAPHIYPLPGRTLATELLLAGETLRTLFLSPLKSQSPCQTAVREVGFTGTGLYLMPAHIVSDGVRIVKSDRRLCFRRGVGELGAPRRGGEEVD